MPAAMNAIRTFHKFSLSKLIQRAHQKITLDPNESHALYQQLTSDFRQQLNKRTAPLAEPHGHVDKSIAAAVAKLHLADHRHVRLVNLLSRSPAPVTVNPLLPPILNTTTTTTTTLLPDLYSALLHVPEAEPSDYALAISLTTHHAPTRAFALHESHKIYSLYLSRHPTCSGLNPRHDDALDPLTQLVRTYLIHGHTRAALDLLDPLLTPPSSPSPAPSSSLQFQTWLNAPPSDPANSHYASALHLFTQAMTGLRLAGDLDLAARVYRAAQRLLRMDLYFAFEPRPPYTRAPAPAGDQSAIVMHLAATLDADRARDIWRATAGDLKGQRPNARLHLTPRAYAALWQVLTLGGYAHDGFRVLVDRLASEGAGRTLDSRVAGTVVSELFARREEAHVAMSTLDRLVSKWPGLRLADHVWVGVFQAVRDVGFVAGAGGNEINNKWWVPVSRMASADDPTRAVRSLTHGPRLGPPMSVSYLEQVVNLYAAYVLRSPNACPAASVGSAFVDCLVMSMVEDEVHEEDVRRVLEAWLTAKESERVVGWIRARRGSGIERESQGIVVPASGSPA